MPTRMVTCVLTCLAVMLVGAWLSSAEVDAAAGSLWGPGSASLFADHKAGRVGDLVTVLIMERSYASHKAETGTGKGVGVNVAEGIGLLSFLPQVGFGANTKSSGQDSTARSGNLVAKMTARVVEVLPDGNLRIEGTQGLVINKERQNIVITGIIRPEDVGSDNTVLSTYIGDAEIRYDGALNVEQKTGLLSYLQRFFQGVIKFIF